jgi:two-component system phosphate regulon sensor histidine kinase PhoR
MVPLQSSLRARLIFLFVLLVTVPLTFSGIILGLTGRESVLSAGAEMGRVGEESFRQSTRALERQAIKSTREAASQLVAIGQEQIAQLGRDEAHLGAQSLREYGQKISTTATDTLRDASERLVQAADAVIDQSNRELRRLQADAAKEASSALIREARQAFEETGQQLIAVNRESMVTLAHELNLERARRTAEQTRNLLIRTQEIVRQTARPLPRTAPTAPPPGAADGTGTASETGPPRALIERRVQNWNVRLRQSLPLPILWARLYTPEGEWIPALQTSDAPGDDRELSGGGRSGEDAALPSQAAAEVSRSGRGGYRIVASPGRNAPEATLFVPVPGAPPAAPSVFVVRLSLDFLADAVARPATGSAPRSPTIVASLADNAIMAHSDSRRVGSRISPEESDLLAAARRQSEGTMHCRLPGIGPALCAFATVSLDDGTTNDPRQRVPTNDALRRQRPDARRQSPGARVDGSTPGPAPSAASGASPLWVVVALQPLDEVLARAAEMQRAIRSASRQAADQMEAEARRRTNALMTASIPQQRRIAAAAAARIRKENRARVTGAVAALGRQQHQIAAAAQQQITSRSRRAAVSAGERMQVLASNAADSATGALRYRTGKSSRLGLDLMQQKASMTANDSAERMILNSLLLIAVFLGIALAAATLTARSLVRPITEMAEGTAAIARGDFSHRVPVQSRDELGALALAFNDMAEAVQRHRWELEASNATLEREKSRVQAIVESSPDGLAIVDERDRVTVLNPSARQLLHLPAGFSDETSFADLRRVLPEDAVVSLEEWSRNGSASDPRDLALEAPHRVLQVRCVPLGAGEGKRAGADHNLLLHLHDVTREREIDEMKSSFVSLVSHELRTPLTSILGFSSYLLTERLGTITDAQRTGLESIHRQANRLKAIIADFLDLARIESGRIEIRREPVAVGDITRRAIDELRPQAAEKGLQVTQSGAGDDGAPWALGDDARLSQVLTNLIGNAIKFTDRGGTVQVALEHDASETKIHVRDTGIGIPEEELPRIFDRFYQVEKVATRKAGGTGLGLSIVKHLVDSMGGAVSVQSHVGEGTCFTVSLSTVPCQEATDARKDSSG